MAVLKKTTHINSILVIAALIVLTYVPHIAYVTDKIYSIDRFFHFDYFVMSAGWAHLKGQTIFVDVNSNYSVGMTVLLSRLANLGGGFDYPAMAFVVMALGVLYWCIGFMFLRVWLKNVFLAGAGIFLAVNLEMFHGGVSPLVWRFPSATVIRHLFDLGVFFALLQHSRSSDKKYLWIASLFCAAAIAYMLDTGVYLTLSFAAYLGIQLLVKPLRLQLLTSVKDAALLLLTMIIPFAGAGTILFLIQGPALFSAQYWHNATEYSRLFLNGFGDLPVTYALEHKQYIAFAFGLLIPVFYTGSLIFAAAMIGQGHYKREQCMLIFMSCYGMLLYHYYIFRSGPTSYDAVIVPAVFLLSFWVKQLWDVIKPFGRIMLGAFLSAGLIAMFACNPWFKEYPNIFFNPKAHPVEHFDADLKADTALIQGLTGKDEPVALISSFETKILMAANRKPLFYYFPFIYSVPFDVMDFHGTEMLTIDRLKRTLQQMQQKRPAYVFVERKLWERRLHPAYYAKYSALTVLMQFLNDLYTPYQNGQYLCALKLK